MIVSYVHESGPFPATPTNDRGELLLSDGYTEACPNNRVDLLDRLCDNIEEGVYGLFFLANAIMIVWCAAYFIINLPRILS